MSDLSDQYIDDTFDGLIRSEVALPSSGQVQIMDGLGNNSSLSFGQAESGLTVTGPLKAGNITFPSSSTPRNLIDLLYPVGAIYLSIDPNINLNGTLGGNWVRVGDGRFLAGAGTGSDGVTQHTVGVGANDGVGRYRHTLTTNEIPAHNHTGLGMVISDDGGLVTGFSRIQGLGAVKHEGSGHTTAVATTTTWGKVDSELIIDNTGSSQSHNNTPPSFGVYIFQRTA